jgi:hypothetical protein
MRTIRLSLYLLFFTLCNLITINNLTAQTAFAKAKDLKKIDETALYHNVVISVNKGKKVPKWIKSLKSSERRIITNTSLFFDAPLDSALNVNLVKPAEFIRIVDAQNPKDTATEDLIMFKMESDFEAVSEYSTTTGAIGTSGGGLASPSAIIDGTARFLVKRTKEELAIAFFDEFRKKIEKDTILPFLLPETHRLLRYQDYFQVPSMGKVWTTAFESDLHDVPLNLDKFLRTQCPQYMDSTALFVFSLGINCFAQVQEGVKVPTLLDNLSENFAFIDTRKNPTNRKIYNSFKFINLLSNELLTSKEGDYNFSWVSAQDFKALGAGGQRYFWSLFYAQYRDFFNKNIGKIKNTAQFNGSYRIVGEMIDTYVKLNGAISYPYVDNSAAAAAISTAQQVLRGTELMIRLDTLFTDDVDMKSLFYKRFLPAAESALSIMSHAEKHEYGAMSLQTVKAMEQILTPIYGKKAPEQLKTFFFYMNFMVDVMTAEDGISVEKIIGRYALPPQSYRLKRHSKFSLALNAFPGISGGFEGAQNIVNQSNKNIWGGAGGVTAPIGLSINKGKLGKNQDLSLSLFVPVIDIGAAFMYRWSEDAQGFPSDLRWSQVFSPGAYLVMGIPRMPITISAGGQLTPKLRDITNGTSVIQSNAVRLGVNVTVDIPFFNLYKR